MDQIGPAGGAQHIHTTTSLPRLIASDAEIHYRIRLRATQEAASLHIVGSSLQSGVLLGSQNRRHGLYEAGPTTDAKGKIAKKSDSHSKNLEVCGIEVIYKDNFLNLR